MLEFSVAIVVLMLLTFGLVQLRNWLSPWRYDERNPARRYCKECGQQQDLYGYDFAEGFVPTGWETVYPISQIPCTKKH